MNTEWKAEKKKLDNYKKNDKNWLWALIDITNNEGEMKKTNKKIW